jgi:predicted alpha/beta superfamily hydrolase/uncharacterized protein YciI
VYPQGYANRLRRGDIVSVSGNNTPRIGQILFAQAGTHPNAYAGSRHSAPSEVIVMKSSLTALCLFALFSAADASAAETSVTPYVKTNGEIRVLPSTRPDRQYQLYIGLPASYGKEPDRRYPVVYFTDAYWGYEGVRAIYWGLEYDKTIPEVILVGIGYVGENLDYDQLRNTDMWPPVQARNMFTPDLMVGQADQFLQMIETQAIPLIEREYRADPKHRVLMGGSLGGGFALYAFFARHDLFQGYVAASPKLQTLWQYEQDFMRSKPNVSARMFISVGGLEANTFRNEIELFHRRVASRSYLGRGYQYRRYDSLRHDGAILMGMQEGLQFVLEPLAPQRGVAAEQGPPLEKDFYAVLFNRTAALPEESRWTRSQKQVMRRHRQLLDDLVKAQKIMIATRTPDGDSHTFASVGISAPSRAAAEAFAAADPAVAAGLLEFEVLSLNESPIAK